jgi:hypothetical protein
MAFALVHVLGLPVFFSRLISSGVERVDKLYLPQQDKLEEVISTMRKEVAAVKASDTLSKKDKRCD